MTPVQIELVEKSLASLDPQGLARDFYDRVFATEPSLTAMFGSAPEVQRARFAGELAQIVCTIRSLDTFTARARALGARHRTYGVRARHYRLMGTVLLDVLAVVLGDDWTPEVSEAWTFAYNLTAEMMMTGALDPAPY
jgi:nitric oxide dioxygenase